jgi:hypothetical protein
MSMPSYINSIKPIKQIDLPKLKLIETDSVPKKSQSLKEWAMAGGGVPESHKDRADVWHKKARNYAAGGAVHMQKGGKMGVGMKIADAVADASKQADEILAVKKAAGKLEEAMKAKQAPMTSPQGTGLPLMPRSQGMYIPGVKQEDLPRMPKVDKARAEGKSPAYTERMQDLLDSPTARKKVDKLINKGKDLNVQEWYGTEPLRQVAMDAGLSPDEFNTLIAQLASASQRNPVDQQNKMGSYLHYLSKTGQLPDDAFLLTNNIKRGKQEMPQGTPIELPLGYGSLAQGDIFSRGKQIASGDIMGALPPDKKLGTFYRNYLGNLKPVTVDVNAVRGPIIERGDPRWLASKLVEKDDEGTVIATHFPRRDVAEGRMSLKEAKDRPGFWEAAPSGSEYAGFEDLWQRGAKRHDISPAEAQALGWYGSADVTALKTKPELYIDNLERMIRRTAEETGQHPLQVMDDVIKGKGFLYAEGGEVHKADGGKIVKGMMGAIEKASKAADEIMGAQKILPAAEREANKAKFLEPSVEKGRMYHATNADINAFRRNSRKSTFVTPDAKFANSFIGDLENIKVGGGQNVMPVRVQVTNPFDYENPRHIAELTERIKRRSPWLMDQVEAMGDFEHNWPSMEHPDIQRFIRDAGHDAFYAAERGTKNLGVYDPGRIKSDIGNKGTYNINNPDLNEAHGGAIHKAEGGAIHEQRFDGGGMAAADFAGAEDDGGNLDKAKIMSKLLADMAKKQGSQEMDSLSKPRALTDLLNRGVLANNPISAGVDLFNMGLGAVGMGSEKPFLGSEHVKGLMDKYGVTSGEDRPLMETALSFLSPTAMIKGATKATDVAKKAPELMKKASDSLTSSKIPPLATEAKTAQAGKPTGATYATKQDGPFYRVSQSTPDQSSATARGVREADGLQAQGAVGAGPSTTGQRVPKQFSDEEVAGLISSPSNKPLKLAQSYTKEQRGADFMTPELTTSSLAKQSAIGRTHMAAVEGSPAYKNAIFDAYAQSMPDVLEQAGAKSYDDLLEKAYRQLAKETSDQFDRLPVSMSFHKSGEGNYKGAKEMASDVHGNDHLYVFQGGDKHDFLNQVDPRTGLNENEKFRAVHDLFGHAVQGNEFGPLGEEKAWGIHKQMYSPLAQLAMTAETRGQNSVVNYTPLNAKLKAEVSQLREIQMEAKRRGDTQRYNLATEGIKDAFQGFQYAPQKAILLPPEYLNADYRGGMPDYVRKLIKPEKGTETQSVLTHYSNRPDLEFTDPRRYGTGIKGAEAERLSDPSAVRDRSYFYMGEPGTVSAEPGLGVNRYRGEASSLYDITQDPLDFRVLARESNRTPYTSKYNQGITSPLQDANDMERLVREYGYQGMANPKASKPMAIMFDQTPVQRKKRGGLASIK